MSRYQHRLNFSAQMSGSNYRELKINGKQYLVSTSIIQQKWISLIVID
jgi:hypothetical protein